MKMRYFKSAFFYLSVVFIFSFKGPQTDERITLSQEVLKDKIKGGWAGQTIGVTFGWPSEFQYAGTFIQDYERIVWREDYINEAMTAFPGLYDDVYMDLMFVKVFEQKGLNASINDFASAYANSEFQLWHANQAGRYNVKQGVMADSAGHWLKNPHADDIDFQIEADFAGLMSPGMPKVATEIANKLGRLMNSGDGLYGGIFVANMYSNAFINDNIEQIIKNSLNAIPKESEFHQCISDVINWYHTYPDNWKQTWFEIQKKWAEEVGCPNMVFHPLNIDAKLNSAYVVLGLLYGEKDYTKTLEISTRAGQDSDCNPSTAAGVLGTVIGYSNIPAQWLSPLQKAEHRPFSYTDYSLEKVYDEGFKQALNNIRKNKGTLLSDGRILINKEDAVAVKFEKNFAGHYPKERISLERIFLDSLSFDFEGNGLVLQGYIINEKKDDYILRAALYVDGKIVEEANFPTDVNSSRTDMFWRYKLSDSRHTVKVKILNPKEGQKLVATNALIYSGKKNKGIRF